MGIYTVLFIHVSPRPYLLRHAKASPRSLTSQLSPPADQRLRADAAGAELSKKQTLVRASLLHVVHLGRSEV